MSSLVLDRDEKGVVNMIKLPLVHSMHNHLRQSHLTRFAMKNLVESGFRGYVVAEPNIQPPVLDAKSYSGYDAYLKDVSRYDMDRLGVQVPGTLTFLVAIQITEKTTRQTIREAHEVGCRIAKVYPRDVTTNSENGVVEYENIYPALEEAQGLGWVVQFHGEHPSFDVEGPKKEPEFIFKKLIPIAQKFKKLKISLEHISTAFAVRWIGEMNSGVQKPRIVGGIAPQYMHLTNDDVSGYSLRSGCKAHTELHCKPMLKWNDDRAHIQAAAVSGEKCWVYAPDDAPHYASQKGPGECNCGIFNAKVGIPVAISLAEQRKALEHLPALFSDNATAFYDLPSLDGYIIVQRDPWVVEKKYPVDGVGDYVISMLAGETVDWRVVS